MPNLNLLLNINSYSDTCPTNAPTLSNFKWTRQISAIPFTSEASKSMALAVSASATLLSSDNKSFLYLESDQALTVVINGGSPITLTPFEINGILKPGVLCISMPITSLVVTNPSSVVVANITFAALG